MIERAARSTTAAGAALAAGVAYLARTQHAAGSWTDFWLPVGTSDAWVTAYVGLALHAAQASPSADAQTRLAARDAAARAAEWLAENHQPHGGWGYNATVPADADSTAHALSLLGRLGLSVPAPAVAFLRAHEMPGEGFKTYRFGDPRHQWTRACADVTAAALRALRDVGELDEAGLREAWLATLAAAQDARGAWHGYWWVTPHYATGLAAEVWAAAGRPSLRRPIDTSLPAACAFDLAWALHLRAICDDAAGARRARLRLIDLQEPDGAWPSASILRVPPSHPAEGAGRTLLARDARRLFVTATAVRVLALGGRDIPASSGAERDVVAPPAARESPCAVRAARDPAARAAVGRRLDDLVVQAARAAGIGGRGAAGALDLFRALTRESLAAPSPWPAAQLSSLAGGTPMEFSVEAGPVARPALRYAVEVGDPFLAPYPRAQSAVEALAAAARGLGCGAAWRRVLPGIREIVAPGLPVPDGLRFWVWGGVDQVAAGDDARSRPVLKIYLNVLHGELGDGRGRLEAALRSAAIPVRSDLRTMLDALDAAGFPHELGFALRGDGRVACKVYYEIDGWQRSLVRALLAEAGLPAEADAVCPAIPGLLEESLARKERAGIALRLDAESGRVRDLTTAAAFLPPLVRHAEVRRRVEAWIASQGWDAGPYRALSALLLPAWEAGPVARGRLHSLFTRTVSTEGRWTTTYLRPCMDAPGAVGGNADRAAGPPHSAAAATATREHRTSRAR
ncbi:MAG: terpene cyclase/mutase family protein [Armatimonadetes bacterium]|nr:terpene cyclase/mutase family protein [Armatimonadota bacterium]